MKCKSSQKIIKQCSEIFIIVRKLLGCVRKTLEMFSRATKRKNIEQCSEKATENYPLRTADYSTAFLASDWLDFVWRRLIFY